VLVAGLDMLAADPELIVALSVAVGDGELVLGFIFLLLCCMPWASGSVPVVGGVGAIFLLSGLEVLMLSDLLSFCRLAPSEAEVLPCARSPSVELMSFALVDMREVFPEEVDSASCEVASDEDLVPTGLSRVASLFAEEKESSLRGLSESGGVPSVALSRNWEWSCEETDVDLGRCFSSVMEAISSSTSRVGIFFALEGCWSACVRSFLGDAPVPSDMSRGGGIFAGESGAPVCGWSC
jgi:hypothetical protein